MLSKLLLPYSVLKILTVVFNCLKLGLCTHRNNKNTDFSTLFVKGQKINIFNNFN